jgi:hypothetical protein
MRCLLFLPGEYSAARQTHRAAGRGGDRCSQLTDDPVVVTRSSGVANAVPRKGLRRRLPHRFAGTGKSTPRAPTLDSSEPTFQPADDQLHDQRLLGVRRQTEEGQ